MLRDGDTLSHYRILERIGQGGMGEIFRAVDQRLDRTVAIKILRPDAVGDPDRKRRFIQEAKAASALNHPNIVTIHEIDSDRGMDFIVMEFVDGRPLSQVIAAGPFEIGRFVGYAEQLTSALAKAHRAGIVHRDIKPANIMITPDDRVKVLDFGLAKLAERQTGDDTLTHAAAMTRPGLVIGTLAYMSPEQAQGEPAGPGSDVFSLGVVLYEMLAARRPFEGKSDIALLSSIVRDRPVPVRSLRGDIDSRLARIVDRCLEKDPATRFASAEEVHSGLVAVAPALAGPSRIRAALARRSVVIPAAVAAAILVVFGVTLALRAMRVREATGRLSEMSRLVEKTDYAGAFRLMRELEPRLAGDRPFEELKRLATWTTNVRTDPPGADVFVKGYAGDSGEWLPLGKSPLLNVVTPYGHVRWSVRKAGYETLEFGAPTLVIAASPIRLVPAGKSPPGMVFVPGGQVQLASGNTRLPDYWLDKFEVTNREYQEFVDQGGYAKGDLAQFRDSTGRPGPSTWEIGRFPENRGDYPVQGVSWPEAAAYCAFRGKSLPTIYHWRTAAGYGLHSDILRSSNFGNPGAAPRGRFQGLGPYGTYDMAGNVKEWCLNEARGASRYLLGGAWSDPLYMFADPDALPPLQRPATAGFRCARFDAPLPESLTGPALRLERDLTNEKPASDETFRVYRNIYAYDPGDLRPAVESTANANDDWRLERVTFNAAYGNERVIVWLLLPKTGKPPYQTVIHFPPGHALQMPSSRNLDTRFLDFIVRGGRAVCYPVYKGTYERRLTGTGGPNTRRDTVIQSYKDLARTIDYLKSRSDIDSTRLAYYGVSYGAWLGPVFTALDDRFRAVILLSGGLQLRPLPAEMDALHFAPRVKAPVLMINGKDDFSYPVERSQKALFRLLGSLEKDKRHVLFDSGHVPPRIQDLIKEVLDWLDRYLGPAGGSRSPFG